MARLLTASVLIALLSIVSTAWLVIRSTTLAIEREQGQVLAVDTGGQDALTGYAARQRNWSGADRLVRELAEETGRSIILTTRASVVIDPLNTAVVPSRDVGAGVSPIDPRAVGPYRLPARERWHLAVLEFADMDGDGRDAYLKVDADGAVHARLNCGGDPAYHRTRTHHRPPGAARTAAPALSCRDVGRSILADG